MAQLNTPLPDLSIVIVSYYTDNLLFDCLSAVNSQQNNRLTLEVIVVDNGNSSDTKVRLDNMANREAIQLISGHGNIGFSAGCNLGVNIARAEQILLLNPDCVMQPNTIQPLLNLLAKEQAKDDNVLVSGWLRNPDGSEQRGLRRNLLTPLSLFIEILPVIKCLRPLQWYRLNLTSQPVQHDIISVDACSGACMLLSANLYKRLGGMDEMYFLHVEDLDFCYRLNRLGGRIRLDTQTRILHQKGASRASGKKVAKHKRDSFVIYFKKHYPRFWRSPLGGFLYVAICLNYWIISKKI